MAKLFRRNATIKKLFDEVSVSLSHRPPKVRLIKRNCPVSTAPEICLTERNCSVSVAAPKKKKPHSQLCLSGPKQLFRCSGTVQFLRPQKMSDEEDRFNNSGRKHILPDEPKHFSHSDCQICFNKAEIFRLNASPHTAEKNCLKKWPSKLCFMKRNSFISSDPYILFVCVR